MVFMMMFGCWAMMCLPLRCMMLGRRRPLCGLVSGGGLLGAALTTTGSRHGRSAESYAGKGENHQLFESLVHSAPSLSSFVLTRTFLAAYIKIGDVSVIF